MSEYLGSVVIPEISTSGVFPVVLDYGSVRTLDPRVIVHRFGHLEAQAEQRYYQGPGQRRFRVVLGVLTRTEKATVASFFESRKGSWQPFTLNIKEPDDTAATYTVRFADPQLTLSMESDAFWSGSIDLIEEPTTTPTFSITTTASRFPGSTLNTALLQQTQEVIPLVVITPGTGSAIYVSDRRVSVGGQLYQPRILDHGGISQSIDGASDEFSLTLGNADRVLTAIANGYDLWNATVEFSFYHVGTATKLDLWKGSVIGFEGAASDEFTLKADEGMPLRMDTPARTILRQDGFVVPEQPVSVGGKKGIAKFTATSVTNDTVYGKPLRQVYVNSADKPYGVDCDVVCGRDESEFYAALGIVGQGPISGFYQGSDANFAHSLEGQTNHGYPGLMGLRRSYGGNPTTGSEAATDNSPDSGSNSFALDEVGHALPSNPLNGVAFLQIRRSDEKGVQPLRPDTKPMRAWLTGGLGAWKWSGGVRSWQPACTNPFWIGLRQWLERKGLQNASSGSQEATFDVSAAEYCAGLADTVVDKIIGTGTEKQFTFVGAIQDARPTRDWISEIIGGALGYYTVTNGKLKFGCRINASAVESFTIGNILLDSLKLSGKTPDANHIVVAYADEDYAYQANALELKDSDFGARAGVARKKNVNLVGCATKSQCSRVTSVIFREMLGGTSLAEWTAARTVEIQTTILALNVEPGMVCSITHTDCPGGVLKFRVTRWRLNRDYSITIAGETVTSSMYDLTVGPKPSDVAPDPIPAKNWYDVGVGTNLKYQSLIGNGSFEQGLLGWTVDSLLSAHAELDDTRFWHGTRSLKITSGATGSATINQPNIAIAGNTSYVFSGFYFRDGLVVDGSLMLAARWIDGAGAPVGTDIEIPIVDGTDTAKVQFAVNATSPPTAVQVIIYAYQGTHSAGTLNVDGLEFKLFSALAAAAPVASVSAELFYSADATGWGMDTTWVWPGDKTTIKFLERRAFFYSDEEGTVEIGSQPLAALTTDTDTNTAHDGGDWEWSVGTAAVRSGVLTVNGDGEPSNWVLSDVLVGDATAVAHPGAYDLSMLASPTITTVGDQFKIEGQFLPGYISAGVSRTVGAAFWWEPGVDGAPSKVGESPYDTTKAGQPSPDNQGSYEVWITKESILTITPDGSGNRTGYLHGLAIEPGAFIPFKPHPTQATTAELDLTFTPSQLAGAVALPDPVAPTSPTLVIDNSTYPNDYIARAGWTIGAGDLSGTAQYRLQWGFTLSNVAPSFWDRDSIATGPNNNAYISSPWPKDKDAPYYGWFRVRAEMGAKFSAWVTLASGVVINAASDTKRPTQPASGDFLMTIVKYTKDSADAASQVYLRLTMTGTQAGDHSECRTYDGGVPSPTDLADIKGVIHSPGYCEFWYPRAEAGSTLFYTATNNPSPNYRVSPAADNTWKSIAIPAVGKPGAVTGYSVTSSAAYKIAGVLHIDINYAFTPPTGTDFMELHLYREQYTDATFTTRVGAAYTAWNPMVLTQSGISKAVKCSDVAEYWKYYFIPVDWLGRENAAAIVTYNATFVKNTGIDLGASDPATLGPGIYLDNGKVGNAARATLMNGDFELASESSWNLNLAAIVAGAGTNGSKAGRLTPAGGFARIDQWVIVQPGEWYRLSWQARNNTSGTMQSWIAWADSSGSYLASPNTSTNGPNIVGGSYAGYSMVVQVPTGGTRAQIVPGYSTAASGTGDVDSVSWEGMPKPGAGQAYDSNGNLVSTNTAALKDGSFDFGTGSWGTSNSPSWDFLPLDSRFTYIVGGGNPGNCLRMAGVGGGVTQLVQDLPCEPGSNWRIRANVKNETTNLFSVGVAFMDASRNPITTGLADSTISYSAGTWQTAVNAKAAPAGACFVRAKLYTASGATGYAYVNNVALEPCDPVGSALARIVTTGVTRVGDYSITEALIADAQISARTSANNLIARTAQIDTGVIVSAHINSLTVLDAFIRNLSVSQITSGGTLALTGALDITTGLGHAASISQLWASFDGPVICPSLTVGSYGIGSTGIGYFSGLNVGGHAGTSGTIVFPCTSMTFVNGILTAFVP